VESPRSAADLLSSLTGELPYSRAPVSLSLRQLAYCDSSTLKAPAVRVSGTNLNGSAHCSGHHHSLSAVWTLHCQTTAASVIAASRAKPPTKRLSGRLTRDGH
jgi:hypothetical protein